MASLIPSGSASGTGSMTLAAPTTNSNQTATLPDATGTVMVSGNMPAFSAYLNTNQGITTGTATKVTLNAKVFDTANCFDSTTNYRFTPNVAGYYQINAMLAANGTTITAIVTDIRKNGSTYTNNVLQGTFSPTSCLAVSDLIYMNGSTDYLELYGQVNATSPNFGGSGAAIYTSFSGSLVRTA
jgi:hypothetical protein